MKRIIQIEIETLDGYEYLSSTETVKEILTNGYNLSYGFRSQNKTILSVSEVKRSSSNPLISNVLPLKMVTLHHTEDKGFYCMEDERALDYLEIAKTNKPIDFISIPYDKDRDNPYEEQG